MVYVFVISLVSVYFRFVIFLKMKYLALTQHVPPRPDNARDISSLGGTQPAVRRTALQRRSGQRAVRSRVESSE